jgi:hypothetical protein
MPSSLTSLDDEAIAASMKAVTLPPHSRFGLRPLRRHFHDDDGHMGLREREQVEKSGYERLVEREGGRQSDLLLRVMMWVEGDRPRRYR